MKTLSIIVSSFKREKHLKRLIESIEKYVSSEDVELVIFNNDKENKMSFESKKIDIKCFNKNINNGKILDVIDYSKDISCGKYIMMLDDKDYFIKNFIDEVNYIKENNYNLYSLKMRYINNPLGIKESKSIHKSISPYQYYFSGKYGECINNGDRAWIFKKDLIKYKDDFDFLKHEISINGFLVNRYFYKEKLHLISKDDEAIVCREYLSNGFSSNNSWWILNEPNTYLMEIILFFNLSRNFKKKVKYIIEFHKAINLVKKYYIDNAIDIELNKKIIRFKKITKIIYYIFQLF